MSRLNDYIELHLTLALWTSEQVEILWSKSTKSRPLSTPGATNLSFA